MTPRAAHNRVFEVWAEFSEAIGGLDWSPEIWSYLMAADTALSKASLALLHLAQATEARAGGIDTSYRPSYVRLSNPPRRTDSP